MGGIYIVDKTSGELSQISGGTLYADLPICSWIKNDRTTTPAGFLKQGDTISATEYPELYAKYGSTVPYKADTSELSEYEEFSLSTTASTLSYDGFMTISALCNNTKTMVYLNDLEVARFNTSGSQDPTVSFSFKKGDAVRLENTNVTITNCKVAYYKKSLIVKAKNIGAPVNFVESVKNSADTTPTLNSTNLITSGGVYNYAYNPIKLINALFNPTTRRVGVAVRKFLDTGSGGNWTHTALVTGAYEFTAFKHNHGNTIAIYVNDVAVCSSPFWGTATDGTTSLEQIDISWSPTIYVNKGDAIRIESDNAPESAKSRWFLNSYCCWGDAT